MLATVPTSEYSKSAEEAWNVKGACHQVTVYSPSASQSSRWAVYQKTAPGGLWPCPLQPYHRISFEAVMTFHFLSTEPFWELGNWTHCSATCGHLGARVQRPRCALADGQEVSEALCQHLPKPLAGFQPCNIRDCPSRYVSSTLRFSTRFGLGVEGVVTWIS